MKSDYICKNCKQVKGSGFLGNSTERYKCPKCGDICKSCVKIFIGIFSDNKRECRKCGSGALLYEFNSRRGRWEKA